MTMRHVGARCISRSPTRLLPRTHSVSRDAIYDLLQECSRNKDLLGARHAQAIMAQTGFDSVSVLADHLIRLFTLCGSLPDAEEAFRKVTIPTVFTWNSMILAHIKLGKLETVLDLHRRMQLSGVISDKVTFLCILKVCGSVRAITHGRLVHFMITTSDDALTGVENMLVDMYSKCDHMKDAQKVFDSLLSHDVVSWGALMTGYAQQGNSHEVLQLFLEMRMSNMKPNKVVFLAALRACGGLAAVKQGRSVHAALLESEIIIDMAMGSALVDMYAKCGYMMDANNLFLNLPNKDVKAWGALISGYAASGTCILVEKCFLDMKSQGVVPDSAIFISVLASYSHAGLLHQAHRHFRIMIQDYGIKPQTEHYNCMVDLLGRAGQLKEAKVILETMFVQTNITGWLSLLTSCRTYTNPFIGRQCFTKIREIEPSEARGYMIMSNIYVDCNMRSEAEKIQDLRKRAGAWRKPGKSCIEIDSKSYEFFVGSKINSQSALIYEKLDSIHKYIKEEGYIPHLEIVLEPVIEFKH